MNENKTGKWKAAMKVSNSFQYWHVSRLPKTAIIRELIKAQFNRTLTSDYNETVWK